MNLYPNEAERLEQFPVAAKQAFFGHAGVTALPRCVADAVCQYTRRSSEEHQEFGEVLADIKATQHTALTPYAWVDKSAGTVRLPIERAKQLIVERGLPTAAPAAPAAPEPAAEGATAPVGDHGAPAAPAESEAPPKAAATPH